MSTVLGIDLGTQSLKVLFYDPAARETSAVASAKIDLARDAGGVAEQRADWWLDALRQALGQVDGAVRESVVAIGVSGQQHGFVPIDRDGNVLAPVKLWCDTSTQAECAAITSDFGGRRRCIDRLGNPILPGYTASKIRWFRDAHPRSYALMDTILLPHDYLNYFLTGTRSMEAGDASGTGLLDIRTRDWCAEMLVAVDPERDLGACLPDVRRDIGPIGELKQTTAARLGLPAGVPVSTGGGDNMMGAIGTGNVRPGTMTVSLGTSGTVYAYSDAPVIDPGGEIAAFCSSSGGWLPLLCTMNCTASTELVRSLFDTDIEALDAQLLRTEAGADGIVTVPFFGGERTPDLPRARGCIFGLTTQNMRPENFLRSAVEGATFALRFGIDRLAELGSGGREIVLTGGGANNAAWRQIVADVCDVPVTVYRHSEAAALGAALQALAMLDGAGADLAALCADHLERDESRCVDPRSSAVGRYAEVYEEYGEAVDKVAALYS